MSTLRERWSAFVAQNPLVVDEEYVRKVAASCTITSEDIVRFNEARQRYLDADEQMRLVEEQAEEWTDEYAHKYMHAAYEQQLALYAMEHPQFA